MISKKLTSKAGITIPKALRADMGWQPNGGRLNTAGGWQLDYQTAY